MRFDGDRRCVSAHARGTSLGGADGERVGDVRPDYYVTAGADAGLTTVLHIDISLTIVSAVVWTAAGAACSASRGGAPRDMAQPPAAMARGGSHAPRLTGPPPGLYPCGDGTLSVEIAIDDVGRRTARDATLRGQRAHAIERLDVPIQLE